LGKQQPALPAPQAAVAEVFADYPPAIRARLMEIRALIFKSAAAEEVGEITETLKWGEPAYLTSQSKSGSTIRIGAKRSDPARYAVYFNCQTTLVDTFRTLFPEMKFDGNRAIVLDQSTDLPADALRVCIAAALTYHRRKKAVRAMS
jgi:hypothetical protein